MSSIDWSTQVESFSVKELLCPSWSHPPFPFTLQLQQIQCDSSPQWMLLFTLWPQFSWSILCSLAFSSSVLASNSWFQRECQQPQRLFGCQRCFCPRSLDLYHKMGTCEFSLASLLHQVYLHILIVDSCQLRVFYMLPLKLRSL